MFAGTGIVGYSIKNDVKEAIANDLEFYSYIALYNTILNKEKVHFDIPSLDPVKGFITNEYAIKRKYYSEENASLIDAYRNYIFSIEDIKIKNYLLFCLLEASDKVANTASVYGAYLKKLKATALKRIDVKNITYTPSLNDNKVHNENILDLISFVKGDILYLDPPYNHRQYSANYHLLNTILREEEFEPSGKTGLNKYNKSLFCSKKDAKSAMEYLIENANFSDIFVSYNNEGIINKEDMIKLLSSFGKVEVETMRYKRFNSGNSDLQYIEEILYILKKD